MVVELPFASRLHYFGWTLGNGGSGTVKVERKSILNGVCLLENEKFMDWQRSLRF